MKIVEIDIEKTYTKSAYAREKQIARSTLDARIKAREVKVVKVKGTTLIIAK